MRIINCISIAFSLIISNKYCFARGRVFKFGATGDWYGEKRRINAFQARNSVEEN